MQMYDQFSIDYDRFVNWDNRLAYELPFLERALAGRERVLDAACGTGRHAIALAQRGFKASGADLSAGMIERARANAKEAGVEVDFQQAGFGELARSIPPGTGSPDFDGVLCLGNSLPHAVGPGALEAALRDFAACLRPSGVLILQNRNFDAVSTARNRWMEPQSHREGEREWLFLRFYDFLPSGLIQFNVVTLQRERDQPWQQQITSSMLRPLTQSDLAEALPAAGFDQIEWFGGLGGESFDPAASGNLVVLARKKADG
ncbi:protein containg methyltransferase domain [Longilinea arvoryzae]|uniref:Protein containg methyltransferase domain n=1 Tax=Longilinea arvoryzae TaxID=360412 RepID=A0A0S7BEJ2_9CHLR|nr:class I SAM-dependent methyltransferase [Longilinea arvoryzae]GAP13360.1 protein containg methyltransferase domain [Longilinea arvoryzae]